MVGTKLQTLNVTIEPVKRACTEEEIALFWGNLFRVLDEMQRIAKEMQES